MRKEAIEALVNFLEFTRVAMEEGFTDRILDEMDLSDDAWDDSIYELKLLYHEKTGEFFH